MSRVLTFDAEHSTNSFTVEIFDDVEREAATETINLQLSFVEEESNSLLLRPRQANVNIQDNDGGKKQQYLFTKLVIKWCTKPCMKLRLKFKINFALSISCNMHPLCLCPNLCSGPSISLDQEAYMAMENATLNVTIIRSGYLSLPVTVYLTTAPISSKNAAIGKL